MKLNEENSDFRRIQLTGGSSYIISLPKDWIKNQKLSKGSLVQVTKMENSSLCIIPREHEPLKGNMKALINASSSDNPESIVSSLISAYIQGYNIIKIKTDAYRIDPDLKITIKNTVRKKLVGTEILSETSNEIILQILLTSKDLSIIDTLKRMVIITSSMHRDAFSSLDINDHNLLNEIINMGDEVERFNLYIERLLFQAVKNPQIFSKDELIVPNNMLNYRLILAAIKKISDYAINIVKNNNIKNSSSLNEINNYLIKLDESAIKMFETSIIGFLTNNKEYDIFTIQPTINQNLFKEIMCELTKEDYNNYQKLIILFENIILTTDKCKEILDILYKIKFNDKVIEY